MKRAVAFLASAVLLVGVGSVWATDFGGWSRTMPITFSGYGKTETLTNFPALVTLNESLPGFSYAEFSSPADGADLRFSAGNQVDELNYEIEKWDANGTSLVWVQVPLLAGTNTQIRAFWGNPSATAPACTTNGAAWGNQYAGVWHLGETNGLTRDATANRNHGSNSVSGINRASTGTVDGAYAFSNPGAVNCGTNASLNVGYASWEAWVFPTNMTITSDAVIGKGYNAAYWYGLAQTTGRIRLHCAGGTGNAPLHDSATAVPSNQWTHIMSTWDGQRVRHYINGVLNTNMAEVTAARTNAAKAAFIGANYADGTGASANLGYYFPGRLDEIRVSSAPRASNWVWATWMSAASNETFAAYGTAGAVSLAVEASDATSVGATNALLNGRLVLNNGVEATEACFCWDYADKGTASTGDWAHVEYAGNAFTNGQTFAKGVAGLLPGNTYVYRCFATNATGSDWSSFASSFTTVGFASVTNTGALPLSPFVELLQGAVTGTGGDTPPQVWFLYWLSGDATTNAYGMGVQTGACSATVAGLLPGSNYGYLLMASNLAGVAYSGTNAFMMTAETVFYVATNGNNSADGLSWGTAVSNVEVAVQRAGLCTGTVVIGNGNFAITSSWVQVTNAITIRSLNGPTNTSLDAADVLGRRLLYVSNSAARVFGLTLKRGNYKQAVGLYGPGGMHLASGLVSNCVITANNTYKVGGGAYVTGGLLTDCRINGNTAIHSSGDGGGLTITQGEVANCIISNNMAYIYGSGVNMSGGRLRDCLIIRNYQSSIYANQGCGVYMSGGILERCIVRENNGTFGGGVFMTGGRVMNGVVANNFGAALGGGIYMTNSAAKLVHVTVAGNTAAAGGAGIYMAGGAVSNSIVAGNGYSAYQNRGENVLKTGGTIAYSASAPLLDGTGNILVEPFFLNAGAGDFHLLPGSPCIDAAAVIPDITDALGGTARALDGDGNGSSVPDMGAYEASAAASLACRFSAVTNEALLQLDAVLTATATGPDTAILWYGWDVDNNGVWDYTGADKGSVSHTFGPGFYTVKLAVSNASEGATCTLTNYIRVAPLTNYVARSGNSDTPPYDTWQKAASNILSAVDAAWSMPGVAPVVLVSTGTYSITRTLRLVTNVTVRSLNGPTGTVVDAAGITIGLRRPFYVDAPDAVLDGFTGKNGNLRGIGSSEGPGAGLWQGNGLVSNCIITANNGYGSAGAYVIGGRLVSSLLSGNVNNNANAGAGLYLTGGSVLSCVISNNTTPLGNSGPGGGAYVTGGVLSNCVIRNNTVGNTVNSGGSGGGIYMIGGSVLSCTIADNRSYAAGGGVYMTSGLLRNCLLAGNTANGNAGGGGIFMTNNAVVESCTVCDNATTPQLGNGICMRGGALSNSIVYFNGTANLFTNAGTVAYSCVTPLPAGAGNTAADPLFENRAAGNYRLSALSTVADIGSNQAWMVSGVDRDGSNRIANAVVDMGAYERAAAGGSEPLQCSFSAPTNAGLVSLDVVFTALLSGADTNNVHYGWNFGDSTVSEGYNLGTVSHTYGVGYFTVTLTVNNGSGEVTNAVRPFYIQVAPLTNYVAKGGLNLAPYETWERAASNVADALNVGSTTILVSNGTYQVDSTISIVSDVTVRGLNGRDATIFDGMNANQLLILNASNAVIDGVTFRRGSKAINGAGAGGINLLKGTIANSIIENNNGHDCGGILIQNGTVINSIIRNNNATATWSEGGGVNMTGGLVENCIISNNTAVYAAERLGGGIRLAGGTVRGSLITANTAAYGGGGIYASGGSVLNCTVTSNSVGVRGGGVLMIGGLLRNSLIAWNGGTSATNGGGVYMSAGIVESCTIATNWVSVAGGGLAVYAGTVTNTVIAFNAAASQADIAGLTTNCAYSCSPDLTDGVSGNIGAAPLFRNRLAGDFRLAPGSAGINRGLKQDWMTGSLDLAGERRLIGPVDMGAYESANPGGTILFIR